MVSYKTPKRLSTLITLSYFDKMKEREFLEQVSNMPVFTTKQVSAIIGNKNYSKVFLHRMVDRGLIRRLKSTLRIVEESLLLLERFQNYMYLILT